MPNNHVIRNCIQWNNHNRKKALHDAENPEIKVPNWARIWTRKPLGILIYRQMTPDEWRAARARDALRHSANIDALEARYD